MQSFPLFAGGGRKTSFNEGGGRGERDGERKKSCPGRRDRKPMGKGGLTDGEASLWSRCRDSVWDEAMVFIGEADGSKDKTRRE